jgi:acetylornithine deacetylase/succinyl-diaminopimelate desuccinylase-like protein
MALVSENKNAAYEILVVLNKRLFMVYLRMYNTFPKPRNHLIFPILYIKFSPKLKEKVLDLLRKYNMKFFVLKEKEPLYVKKDSFLVKTLTDIYQEITGDPDGEPRSTGGGTYAKAVKNCVAFGALLKGTKDTMHQKNECIDLSTIDVLLKIYIEAIYRLANS